VRPLNFRPRAAPRPVSNELAKALIINTATGASFPVMYNPEEFKLDQGNTFAEVGIPGLNTPPVQYVRGKARTLTMELFFDTYETGEDVRGHTGPIVRLLDKQPQTQGPPILLFSMGGFQFQCVLVDAGQRFTMFLRDGTPVRSILSVRFQEYVRVDVEIRRGVFFGSPTVSAGVNTAIETTRAVLSGSATVHITVEGDTLSGLAAAFLGDAALWRDIARANAIDDPFDLSPGRRLVIPSRGSGAPRGPGRGRP
jgi:nucleoid-associated protein YgaU